MLKACHGEVTFHGTARKISFGVTNSKTGIFALGHAQRYMYVCVYIYVCKYICIFFLSHKVFCKTQPQRGPGTDRGNNSLQTRSSRKAGAGHLLPADKQMVSR